MLDRANFEFIPRICRQLSIQPKSNIQVRTSRLITGVHDSKDLIMCLENEVEAMCVFILFLFFKGFSFQPRKWSLKWIIPHLRFHLQVHGCGPLGWTSSRRGCRPRGRARGRRRGRHVARLRWGSRTGVAVVLPWNCIGFGGDVCFVWNELVVDRFQWSVIVADHHLDHIKWLMFLSKILSDYFLP